MFVRHLAPGETLGGEIGDLPSGDGAGLEGFGECIRHIAGALLREAFDEDFGSVGVSGCRTWDGWARGCGDGETIGVRHVFGIVSQV